VQLQSGHAAWHRRRHYRRRYLHTRAAFGVDMPRQCLLGGARAHYLDESAVVLAFVHHAEVKKVALNPRSTTDGTERREHYGTVVARRLLRWHHIFRPREWHREGEAL